MQTMMKMGWWLVGWACQRITRHMQGSARIVGIRAQIVCYQFLLSVASTEKGR